MIFDFFNLLLKKNAKKKDTKKYKIQEKPRKNNKICKKTKTKKDLKAQKTKKIQKIQISNKNNFLSL